MSMAPASADYLVDRRRLRRKLLFWRVAGLVLVALIVVGLALRATSNRGVAMLSPHIARVKISGLITGDDKTIKLLRDVGSSRASGLILDIDSPGGTTVGAEKVYDEIRAIAAKKPVVAEISTLGASGAYIAALGADHIVARGNSLVGSIGVLFEFPNVSKLLDTVGVSVEKIKSAPLKAEPDGFTPDERRRAGRDRGPRGGQFRLVQGSGEGPARHDATSSLRRSTTAGSLPAGKAFP